MSIDDVTDITPRRQYTAAAAQDEFDYPFPIFAEADLVVDVDGVIRSDYTVTGVGNDTGGTVTFDAPLDGGEIVTLWRETTIERTTDYATGGPFTAARINDELDRLVIIDQEQDSKIGRCIRFPLNSTQGDAELSPISNWLERFVFINADGELEPAASIALTTLTQSIIGALLYPLSVEEQAAGLTNADLNRAYEYGDVRRFLAQLDGATNDTTALTKWASVPGHHSFPVASTALITAAIPLVSNSSFEFAKGGTIQTATPGISLFTATSKTNISIRGAKFLQTGTPNATSEIGGVALISCESCEVIDCEFEGMQWAGVFLNSSNNCKVIGNHFHDFLASAAGDKCDICVYRNSSYNTIQGNRCYGGEESYFGILVQDPGGIGTWLPKNNTVESNFVDVHGGYGIAVYIGGSVESHNKVLTNDIANITGSADTFFGSGIYCVGFGLGGLQVIGNNVKNCCIDTTSTLNAPGGITITGTAATDIPPVVSNNVVEGMTQGSGINIESCLGGASVDGNTVRMPSTNDGTGPGGASLAGQCIAVRSSSNVAVSDNVLKQNGPQDAILCLATANQKNIKITGNGCQSAAGNPIRMDRTAAFVHTNVVIADNTLETASNTPNCLALAGLDRASITGNSGGCGTQPAMTFSACTGTRVAGNVLNQNGAVAVTTTGTCTDSFYDRSNQIPGTFTNGGTGFVFEKLLTGSATYDPPSLADGAGATTTVTITGIALGDFVEGISFGVDLQGISVTGYISAANTGASRFQNESGGVLDLASSTLRMRAVKQ